MNDKASNMPNPTQSGHDKKSGSTPKKLEKKVHFPTRRMGHSRLYFSQIISMEIIPANVLVDVLR